MSNTIRNYNLGYYVDNNNQFYTAVDTRRIKKVDKKHGLLVGTDGSVETPLEGNDGIIFMTAKQKSYWKRYTSRQNRHRQVSKLLKSVKIL